MLLTSKWWCCPNILITQPRPQFLQFCISILGAVGQCFSQAQYVWASSYSSSVVSKGTLDIGARLREIVRDRFLLLDSLLRPSFTRIMGGRWTPSCHKGDNRLFIFGCLQVGFLAKLGRKNNPFKFNIPTVSPFPWAQCLGRILPRL